MSDSPQDAGGWLFSENSATLYDLMTVLDQCILAGDLTLFHNRVEHLISATPPPLALLSELNEELTRRRRVARQHEFDAGHRRSGLWLLLRELDAAVPEFSGWLHDEAVDEERRALVDDLTEASAEAEAAAHAVVLIERARALIEDWLRALSTTAGRGRRGTGVLPHLPTDPPEQPPQQ